MVFAWRHAHLGAAALVITLGTTPLSLAGQAIRGYLLDVDSGAPIELATLTLLTTNGDAIDTAVTDTEGAFSLEGSTEALFRFMPGVRVMPSSNLFGSDERVVIRDPMMGWCRPAVFIDGVRAQYRPEIGQTLSSLVPVGWVEAVEVYVSAAQIPLEYGITSSETCGVILFWLKR